MFRDGWLTEASASNVLIVRGGTIVAPPKDHQILPGITYDATIEFAREAGMPMEIRPVRREEALSALDYLTGLPNRRALCARALAELSRAEREQTSVGLVMMDIDHFKKVNDQHGHPAGDQVLKQLATVIRNSVRATDFVARYGGEEFAAILPEASTSGASVFAERIRSVLAATPILSLIHISEPTRPY